MKCEIHKTEMKWEGDMLTGGPVCPCCNLPDYEEEDLREKFMENRLTKRLPEGAKLRQTGRTSRALFNLIKACSEEHRIAIYVVHHRVMFPLIERLLREMRDDGIDFRQTGHDRFLVSFENMRPVVLILAVSGFTNLKGIEGRTAYDHFIYEKALSGRVSGDSGEGRGD